MHRAVPSLPRSIQAGLGGLAMPALAHKWLLLGLATVAIALRLSWWNQPGLHPDEALYGSWALRIADGSDPALLGAAVDKPPLQLYLLAAVFRLAQASPADGATGIEIVGRLPGLAASLLSLVLLFALARRVYSEPVALMALAVAAVSPLAVRLSPTFFTDPLLTLWLLLGLWAAVAQRPWLTGFASGLAYATKQQAVLFIPLLLAAYVLAQPPAAAPAHPRRSLRRTPAWGLANGFLLVLAVVTWWDSLRWQWLPSYWERSLTTYGGMAVAPLALVPGQVAKWGELLGYALGSPALIVLAVAGLPLLVSRGWRSRQTVAGRFDLLWLGAVAGYLLVHVATTTAAWDRYALPLVPLLALITARGLEHLLAARRPAPALAAGNSGVPLRRAALALLAVVLVAGLAHSAWRTQDVRLPVGDGRAYDGLARASAYVRETFPGGAVLYHQRLGWHYSFYLYGAAVELRWWDTAEALAAKVSTPESRPQLMALLDGPQQQAIEQALTDAGLLLTPQLHLFHQDGTPSLTLYRLQAGPAAAPDHDR